MSSMSTEMRTHTSDLMPPLEPPVQLAVQPDGGGGGRAAHNTARVGRAAMVLLVKVHADACVALAIDAAVRVLILDV